MTNPINTALMNLIQTVHELNRPDFTVFLQYTGHIQSIEARYCAAGYETNKNAEYLRNVRLYDAFNDGVTDEQVAENIEEMRLKLVEASENNSEELERAKAKAEAADRAKYAELKAKFEKVEA